jgi:hypothetical protein
MDSGLTLLSEKQSPVLVHNRIEKNHRITIILLALVPLVLRRTVFYPTELRAPV